MLKGGKMKKKFKPESKSSKFISILSNCIFVPVMIILVLYFMYALSIMSKNGVPEFFGQSYARVMSNSMKASGIEKGDIAIIQKTDVSDIKEGDIIAFYYCVYNYTNLDGTAETANDFKTGQKTFKTIIYFHKVYDIQYDSSGNTWFFTYGTSNLRLGGDKNSDDIEANYKTDKPTRGDHVIGKKINSPLGGVIQFISSPTGLFILVIVPCAILLFVLLLNMIEIIDQMMKEKKKKLEVFEEDPMEREIDVTTIIEENEEIAKKEK